MWDLLVKGFSKYEVLISAATEGDKSSGSCCKFFKVKSYW